MIKKVYAFALTSSSPDFRGGVSAVFGVPVAVVLFAEPVLPADCLANSVRHRLHAIGVHSLPALNNAITPSWKVIIMNKANPINIHVIDHVVLRANDLDRLVMFYSEVLGCRLERGPGEIGLAQMRAGHSLIDIVDVNGPLGRKAGRAPDRDAPNMDHLCLQVRPWDPDAIQEHLREHGVDAGEIVSRYGALGKGPSLYIKDPEGNSVELKGLPVA